MAVLRRLLRGLHAIAPDGNELASKPVALRHAHYCFKQWEANSLKVAFSGLKFFYAHTCPREWPTLSKLRVPKQVKLPTVLSVPEFDQLSGAASCVQIRASATDAAAATLIELARNPKYIGSSKLGFTGVLHPWGRTLSYHPHIHCIVPGGAISEDGQI